IVRTSVRTLLRVGARPETSGFEHVPASGGFIVASNHLSFLDSVIIQSLLPRQVRFFAKADYWTQKGLKGKIMRGFFDSVGSIPVERGDHSASVTALRQLVDFIGNGRRRNLPRGHQIQRWSPLPRSHGSGVAGPNNRCSSDPGRF